MTGKRQLPRSHEGKGGFLIGDGGDAGAELGLPFPLDLIVQGGRGDDENALGMLEKGPGENGHGFAKTWIPCNDGAIVNGGTGEVFALVGAEGEACMGGAAAVTG